MKLFGRRERSDPQMAVVGRDVPAGVNIDPPARGFQLGPTFGSAGSLEAPDDLLALMAGMSSSKISRADALSVPALLRARNMIAGIPSTLPINVHDATFAIDNRNTVVSDPDPDNPPSWVYAKTIEDLLFESVSYWRVTRFGVDGWPMEAHHVDLRAVSQHAVLGMPSEVLSEDLPFSPRDPVFIDGYPVPSREIIRFVSPNPPLLKHAARAIRMLLLLDKVTEVYANDPMPLGYFTDREDADPLDDAEVTEVLDAWRAARKARAFGYVPQSLELKTVQWDATKIQLIEARRDAVIDIARATGLDPEDMGVSTTTRTYQNAEQRRTDLIDFVLMPYMNAVEESLSKKALPRTLHARFDASGFLRSSTKERMEAHKIGKEIGAITGDEIRGAEHRPKLTPAQKAEAAPKPAPTIEAPEQRTNGNGSGRLEVVS